MTTFTKHSEAPLRNGKRNALRTILLSACAAAIFAQAAHAEDTPTGNAGKTEEDVIIQATHAVTATKTDTPLIQIPQSISVITSQQILDQGALTMLQATNYTAGATNGGDDPRGDFVNIRGFLAVNYLDGLKRENGFVYLPRSETYTLDRIDVLLGPAAQLYGAGSSGGLVNMETKRPQFHFGGEVTASYGTFDRKQAQFDVTGPISDTVAVRLVGLYRDANSLIHYMPDNRKVVQPSVTWKPSDKTSVTLLGLWQHDVIGTESYMPLAATLYAPPGLRMDRRTLLGEPDINKGPKDDKWLTLLVDHQFSDAIKFHSSSRIEGDKTTYREIYGVYYAGASVLDPFLDANNTTIPRSIFAIKAHYRTFETDNNLQLHFNTGPFTHTVIAGVDYSYFRQLAEQAFAYLGATPINIYDPVYGVPGNDPVYGPQTRELLLSTGFYAQDQIRFLDRASLVLGVRHDHLKNETTGLPTEVDNATTYRAGLSVDVTKGISPYVSYSESFQPVAGLNQFNQSYVPLYGKSYEGGVKLEPVRGAMIRVSYYSIDERNHLVPDPSQPLNSIQAGKVKSKGFEFQGNYNLAQNLTLTVAYAHNKTRITGQDYQEEAIPKDTASLYATKTLRLNEDMSLRIGGGARYVSHQLSGDPASFVVITPHYTLVDAIAAVDYKHWTLQVNALNLLNKYYYAECSQYGSCSSGDPRTFNAAVTYHF
jgi:iron complex outermembrane receptor protein